MEDNLSNTINQLQSMLSSTEGKKNIENMINSLGANYGSNEMDFGNNIGSSTDLFNPDSIMKIKNAMDALQRHDDPRSQLLLALKPYLSSSRGARIDNAIMLLSLGKIPSILKTIRG